MLDWFDCLKNFAKGSRPENSIFVRNYKEVIKLG